MKLLLISLASSIAATTAGVSALFLSYSLILDQKVSGEDLAGIAVFSLVPALLVSAVLYTPGLLWLHKKRRECGPKILFVAVCAVLLNIPAFSVLGYSAASGGFFGAGEAWYFVLAYVTGGVVYGLGYPWRCR